MDPPRRAQAAPRTPSWPSPEHESRGFRVARSSPSSGGWRHRASSTSSIAGPARRRSPVSLHGATRLADNVETAIARRGPVRRQPPPLRRALHPSCEGSRALAAPAAGDHPPRTSRAFQRDAVSRTAAWCCSTFGIAKLSDALRAGAHGRRTSSLGNAGHDVTRSKSPAARDRRTQPTSRGSACCCTSC